jgi:AAT family amino acid transporter
VLVVGLMAYFPDTRVALYVGPAFLVLLTVLFYVFKLQPTNVSQGAVRSAS